MPKSLFVFLFFIVLLPAKMFAQDTIVLKSGDEIQAKVIEVNEVEVSYKKFNYQDGPTFVVSREKVFMIKYADGTHEVINKEIEDDSEDEYEYQEPEYGQNILSINPFSFFGGNFSASYERVSSGGLLGIRIPIAVPVFYSVGNQLGLNVDFKFYPTHQGKVRYYLGPSLAGFSSYEGYFVGGIMFDHGVSFQPFPAFNITLDGAIGMGHYELGNRTPRPFFSVVIWRAGINFGIRF